MLSLWLVPSLLLFPFSILSSPVGDIAAQWSQTPGNTRENDDVCPDYKTCSSNGHQYWQTLQQTISQASPVDRTDGKAIYDAQYQSETIPLANHGASIRPDLQNHGLDYQKMTLWASISKDPETGEESFDAAYGNILDTANGVIIAVENNRDFDDRRKQPDSDSDSDSPAMQGDGLPWSEIMYQTWHRAKDLENSYFAQKLPGWVVGGADLSTFKYSIQNKVDNPQTQQIVKLAYANMGYPPTGQGDTTWRKWTVEETPNWFFALLGTDNCKGTVWLLRDHAGEAGKKVVREIWTRWEGFYPDIWYVYFLYLIMSMVSGRFYGSRMDEGKMRRRELY